MSRAEEKAASRAEDERQLAAGEIGPAELGRENAFFLPEVCRAARIVGIGGRRFVKAVKEYQRERGLETPDGS